MKQYIVNFLAHLNFHISDYLKAKKAKQLNEFYTLCGSPLGCDGKVVENMMRILGKELREEVQPNNVSGIGTECNQKLRGSEVVYQMLLRCMRNSRQQ